VLLRRTSVPVEGAGRSGDGHGPSVDGQHREPPTNLPRALTSFIGRERERVTLVHLLAEAPLLTVAGERQAAYPDGVWLVELAPLSSPPLVAHAVAATLGIHEVPGCPLPATMTSVLQDKRLLVLDNCEHLILACAELATTLLRACRGLQILATSREPLGIDGERAWRVPSLALPDAQSPQTAAHLGDADAVRQFVARAQAVRPGFALTARNAVLIAQVCARLDGMPLALELVAARLAALSLEGLSARLDDRFRLLTGGSRTALPRQQTLRATLDWSYALLEERG
jgi:non-specific serine/threonine protein kinase